MTRDSLLAMDPNILLSILNMKLRDQYESLKAFCEDIDISEDEVIKKLEVTGREYDETTNQFK